MPKKHPGDRRPEVSHASFLLARLSEARQLLPQLRSEFAAAAALNPLPSGLALDLMAISEDGLFGYELVPDRATHT